MESKRKSLVRSKITADIAELCEGVAEWRQTRRHRERMPEQLWAMAVSLARQYGIARIARLARVDYYTLKGRLETVVAPAAQQEKRPSFFELPVSLCAPTGECIIEMEHPQGGRMRIQVKGVSALDLPELSRSFWSRES